jgi:hypothetical protein
MKSIAKAIRKMFTKEQSVKEYLDCRNAIRQERISKFLESVKSPDCSEMIIEGPS